MTDYAGVSLIIAAVLTGIPGTVAAVVSLMTFMQSARRDRELRELHSSVNGTSAKLEAAIKTGSFAEGKAEGIAIERADPQSPA